MSKNQAPSASIIKFSKFPYRFKRIDFGTIPEPLVQVKLQAKYGWQPIWFLVDTGADTTTITVELARILGLNYNSQKKTKLSGIGSQSSYGYPGELTVKLNDEDEALTIRAYFLESDKNLLLLGRIDIFKHFNILFDNKNQQTVFAKI